MIKIKRVYDPPSPADGFRVLVDRLWPRGLTREEAALDLWLKEAAPSPELRKWFAHDPRKWERFQALYREELLQKVEVLAPLRGIANLTLVYAARDQEHNGALVLKAFLEEIALSDRSG